MKASPYAMHVGIIVCIFVVYYDVSLFLHYINIVCVVPSPNNQIPSPDDSRKRMVGYDIFDKITYIIIGLVFGILLVPCVYFLGGLLSGVLYTYSSQLNETSHCLQHLIDFSSNLESVHETVAQAANDTRICTNVTPPSLPHTKEPIRCLRSHLLPPVIRICLFTLLRSS